MSSRSIPPRRVYFEPAGRVHSAHRELISYPPPGYEFVMTDNLWDRAMKVAVMSDVALFGLSIVLSKLLPVALLKALLEKVFRTPPREASLTYSYNHPVFREEPWVVNVEWVNMLAGFDMKHLRRFAGVFQRSFASENCKRILTWCEPARQSILRNLDCRQFEEKIEVVPLAVHSKQFARTPNEDRVRLLFVGSANTLKGFGTRCLPSAFAYDFYTKGGQEVLDAFVRLKGRYPKLELVMRARVPPAVRHRFEAVPGIKFIDEILSWQELEGEFTSADIFLFPCHQITPWGVILDAMSYGLPVVTTDVFGNSELVEDGKTGFLVKPSEAVPYYDDHEAFVPSLVTPRRGEFLKAVRRVDPRVVDDLVAKTSLLVEDEERRRRLGNAGRREVDQGKHSIKARNKQLKAIFDEAIGEP